MLFLPTTSKVFMLGALWAIIGNVCCASSFVLLNSFLPLLVRWHPKAGRATISDGPRAADEVRTTSIYFLTFS